MTILMRWLRFLPFRKPARRSPVRRAGTGSRLSVQDQYEAQLDWERSIMAQGRMLHDKSMRPGRDYNTPTPQYDDKEMCP